MRYPGQRGWGRGGALSTHPPHRGVSTVFLAVVAAMLQSERWIDRLGEPWTHRVVAALRTPLLAPAEVGWVEEAAQG